MPADTLSWPEIAGLIALLSACGLIGGWVWRLQERLAAIRNEALAATQSLQERLHDFQLSVSRDYVARADLAEMRREILDAFRRLEDRFDQATKPPR
jgi:hypothetical protein